MKIEKTEDIVDYSDEKLRQFPAYSDPKRIFSGLSSLSAAMNKFYSNRLGLDPYIQDVEKEYFERALSEHADRIEMGEVTREVGAFLKQNYQDKTEVEEIGSFLRMLFQAKADNIVRKPLNAIDDFIRTSKSRVGNLASLIRESADLGMSFIDRSRESREYDPARHLKGRGLLTDFGDHFSNIAQDLRYANLPGKEKLQRADGLMKKGLMSLEKTKSESSVSFYGENLDQNKISELWFGNLLYYLKIGESIKMLSNSKELFRNIFNTETEDLCVIFEAQKKFYETRIRINFEQARYAEVEQAVIFLSQLAECAAMRGNEEPVSDNDVLHDEFLRIGVFIRQSEHIQESMEIFQDAGATYDEAVSLGHSDVISGDYKTRLDEGIRRTEDRSFRLDGIIARKGHGWIDQAVWFGYNL